jgi:hypothetical protein
MSKLLTAALLASLLLSGCMSVSRWQESKTDGPWCAPDQRAVLYERLFDAYMMSSAETQLAFQKPGGRKRRVEKYGNKLEDYFSDMEPTSSWPNRTHCGVTELIDWPYFDNLYLVSITPMVVVGTNRSKVIDHSNIIDSTWPHLFNIHNKTTIPLGNATEFIVLKIDSPQEYLAFKISELPQKILLGENNDYLILEIKNEMIIATRKILSNQRVHSIAGSARSE